MSFLIRRNPSWAWAGWRDLDPQHARPDENPIQPPWRKVNSNRTVQLVSNQLVIADALETPFQVGGVSYEQMPFTHDWGAEFDINIDGNIIQEQFFAMAITSSWAKVGFADLIEVPMVAIWRNPTSVTQNIRVIVYHSLADIQTLSQSANIDGLINKNWYRFKITVDQDRLIRAYVNGTIYFAYWLPAQYAAGPDKRGLNLLNQTTNPAYIKNYILYDRNSDLSRTAQWATTVINDNFGRTDGAVGNGWTQVGTAAGIVSGSWSPTGTSNASTGLIRDTGTTNGIQRVEAVIGGNTSPNTTADSSLVLRATSDGASALVANIYSSSIFISQLSGGLANPTMADYTSTAVTITAGDRIAFSCKGECAWVERNGQIVLIADLNGQMPATRSYAGLRVERSSSTYSASWNEVQIYTALG